MTDVVLGTLYEVNQQLMRQVPDMENDEISSVTQDLMAWLYTTNNTYYMLLCKENSDYTVFNLGDNLKLYETAAATILEVVEDRGPLISVDYNKDNDFYEIWFRDKLDDNAHMFACFPYDFGVVKV